MTTEEKRRIHELAAEGLSARAIARVVGSTHPTISKVLAEPAPVDQPHMAPPPLPPEAQDDGAPALQVVRELLAEARRQFAISTSQGDSGAAQRYARTASGLMPVLARLEREDRDDDGAVRISRDDAAEIEESLRERWTQLLSRPLLCAKCSSELQCELATGGEQHEDPNATARAR